VVDLQGSVPRKVQKVVQKWFPNLCAAEPAAQPVGVSQADPIGDDLKKVRRFGFLLVGRFIFFPLVWSGLVGIPPVWSGRHDALRPGAAKIF